MAIMQGNEGHLYALLCAGLMQQYFRVTNYVRDMNHMLHVKRTGLMQQYFGGSHFCGRYESYVACEREERINAAILQGMTTTVRDMNHMLHVKRIG